jgi:hypothetical protein
VRVLRDELDKVSPQSASAVENDVRRYSVQDAELIAKQLQILLPLSVPTLYPVTVVNLVKIFQRVVSQDRQ